LIVTNNGDSLNCKITEVKNEEVYARTNRMGVYLYPQFNFFNKKTPNHPQYNNIKGNGLTYDGGIYFEKIFGNVGLSAGVGYMQFLTLSMRHLSGIFPKTPAQTAVRWFGAFRLAA